MHSSDYDSKLGSCDLLQRQPPNGADVKMSKKEAKFFVTAMIEAHSNIHATGKSGYVLAEPVDMTSADLFPNRLQTVTAGSRKSSTICTGSGGRWLTSFCLCSGWKPTQPRSERRKHLQQGNYGNEGNDRH
jgi:hypothetical protein